MHPKKCRKYCFEVVDNVFMLGGQQSVTFYEVDIINARNVRSTDMQLTLSVKNMYNSSITGESS